MSATAKDIKTHTVCKCGKWLFSALLKLPCEEIIQMGGFLYTKTITKDKTMCLYMHCYFYSLIKNLRSTPIQGLCVQACWWGLRAGCGICLLRAGWRCRGRQSRGCGKSSLRMKLLFHPVRHRRAALYQHLLLRTKPQSSQGSAK